MLFSPKTLRSPIPWSLLLLFLSLALLAPPLGLACLTTVLRMLLELLLVVLSAQYVLVSSYSPKPINTDSLLLSQSEASEPLEGASVPKDRRVTLEALQGIILFFSLTLSFTNLFTI